MRASWQVAVGVTTSCMKVAWLRRWMECAWLRAFTAKLAETSVLLRGYGAVVVGTVFLVFGRASVQLLHGLVPPFELNAARYLVQTLLSGVLIATRSTNWQVPQVTLPWLCFVAVSSNVFNFTYYTSASFLPLGNQQLVTLAASFVGCVTLIRVFLQKAIHWTKYISIFLVLVGGVLVIQPDPPFHHEERSTPNKTIAGFTNFSMDALQNKTLDWTKSSSIYASTIAGYILAVIAGLALSSKAFLVRLRVNDIPSTVVAFWTGLGGTLFSWILSFYLEDVVIPTSGFQWLLICIHAVAAATNGLFVLYAQQVLSPLTFSVLASLRFSADVLLQYAPGHIFIPGHRNAAEYIGVVLVPSTLLISTLAEYYLNKVSTVS